MASRYERLVTGQQALPATATAAIGKGRFIEANLESSELRVSTVDTAGGASAIGISAATITSTEAADRTLVNSQAFPFIPLNNGQIVELRTGGTAAIAIGAELTSDASGQVIAAATGNTVLAVALQARTAAQATANNLIRVMIRTKSVAEA